MKTFYLKRDFTDEVKQRIAEGVIFSDGTGAILWYQHLDHTFFRSDADLRRQLRDVPGVEIVYAFQTKVPEPKKDFVKTTLTLSLDGKDVRDYIVNEVFDAFDQTISSAGTL